MSIWNAVSGLLLQVQATDTLLVQRVEPSLFHRTSDVAGGLVNIVLLFVVLALIPLVVVLIVLVRRLTALVGRVQQEIAPVSRHANAIADNVNYISTAVRADVQRVSETVNRANQRVNDVIASAEDRVRELQAVLDVVQGETQETLISAAASMRGMRSGAAAIRDQLTMNLRDDDDYENEEYATGDEPFERRRGPRIRRRGGRDGEA